jgi:hypothetical protein
MIDPCERRRFPHQLALEGIELPHGPLDFDLDLAARVAHRARKAMPFRQAIDERTESDALHDSGDAEDARLRHAALVLAT